jgi:hypothetical protein
VPVVLAPLIAFALGALAAAALPNERAADELFARKIVWLTVALSIAPNVAYFLCTSPDWSVAYLFRAARVPSAVLLVVACAASCVMAAGFEVARRLAASGGVRRVVAVAGGALSLALVLGAAFAERLWFVGSTGAFRDGDRAPTLASSWLGLALVVMNALTVAGLVIALGGPAAPREAARGRR